MIINRSTLATLGVGFKANFKDGLAMATSLYARVATEVPSSTNKEEYGWLGKVPGVSDRWGEMKDKDREAIENEVNARLNGRYRELVEAYFESLNKGKK